MTELSSSTAGLVEENRPSHTNQYITTVAASLGALVIGTVLGYTSPASPELQVPLSDGNQTDGILQCGGDLSSTLSANDISWFTSIVNIGGMTGALSGGYLMNRIGRRLTMVANVLPFTTGYALLGKLNSLYFVRKHYKREYSNKALIKVRK